MLVEKERFILDPLSEDATNRPLELTGIDAGSGIYLQTINFPRPDRKTIYAGSIDSRGEPRVNPGLYSNRKIPIGLWIAEEQGIAAATNVVTNPSLETGLTGWSTTAAAYWLNAGATLSQDGTERKIGEKSGKIVTTAASGSQGAGFDLAVTNGVPEKLYIWLKGTAGQQIQLGLGNSTVGFVATTVTFTGSWQLETLTLTPTATGTANIAMRTLTAVARTWYFDGVLAGLASELTTGDYFDGDTPGCAWTGTAHASSSTRKAAAGKRFVQSIYDLERKLEKLAREGGTMLRILPSGDELRFDIREATHNLDRQKIFNQGRAPVAVELTCEPGARGAELAGTDKVETTLPVVIQTEAAGFVKGSIAARGRLAIDDDQNASRLGVVWGIQSRYYDASADAALFYEAEGRTAQGGSAVAVGTAPASGGGSNVMRSAGLTPNYISILSTQATGGGNHLTHVGTYRVFARVFLPVANGGAVSLRLAWSQGDSRLWRRNDANGRDWASNQNDGLWQLVDLGVVRIAKVAAGAQRWEGRLVAKSTVASDTIDVDYLALIPVDEGSGQITAPAKFDTPTVYSARDEFDQSAGALTGKTLPVGGTWTALAGVDTDDFQVSGGVMTRVATADSGSFGGFTGRAVVESAAAALGLVMAQVDFKVSALASGNLQGLILRRSGTSFLAVYNNVNTSGLSEIDVWKSIAGAGTGLRGTGSASPYALWGTMVPGTLYRLRVLIDTQGYLTVWFGPASDVLPVVLTAQHPDLATGGALASGSVGILDQAGAAATRTYDNFAAWVPGGDAAIFATRSLEVRHDRVIRQDAGATLWTPPSGVDGDFLYVPPGGRENRTLRWIVLPTRGDLAGSPYDPGIDDTSARLYITPLYDDVPEPS